MNSQIFRIAVVIVLFLAAGLLSCNRNHANKAADQPKISDQKIIYHCPMHPTYTSDKPGQCPICGMNLVLVEKTDESKSTAEGNDTRAAVVISGEKQQQLGIKTAVVTKGRAVSEIRAVGRVAFDPDLLVAEREFIDAGKIGDKKIAEAARRRLEIMGLGKDQIDELARSGRPDENLTLPKNKAWIYATIYEQELPSVKAGGAATIELPNGAPVGEGVIRAVDSVIDPATRSARARIEIGNSGGALRPNMFVNARIKSDIGERLLVPKSAVIDSGKRKIVFVVHEGNHFSPSEIKLGPEVLESYVVEDGLKEGDIVATNALFLIDSESQLKALIGGTSEHKHD